MVVVVTSIEVEHKLVGVETVDFSIFGSDVPSNLGCTCWRKNHGCIAAEVVYYCHRCLQHMLEVVHCLTSLSLLTKNKPQMNAPSYLLPSPKLCMIMYLCPYQRKGTYFQMYDASHPHYDYLDANYYKHMNKNSS